MVGKTALLLLLLCASALCSNFDSYAARMNKRYRDENERFYRSQIYQKKVAELELINSQQLSYTVGENQFTDLTDAEAQCK
jgi:hypothetical protein